MKEGKKGIPLHIKVLVGLILGALSGWLIQQQYGAKHPDVAWWIAEVLDPLGTLFLRLIYMVIIPLLFSALTLGIMELGGAKKLGRIGIRALLFTVILSGTAVGMAVIGTNLVQPGKGFSPEQITELTAKYGETTRAEDSVRKASEQKGFVRTVVDFVPSNPVESASTPNLGGVLQFMVFAVFFGIALATIDAQTAAPVKSVMEGIFAASQRLIEMAMVVAPVGVFALIFKTSATLGLEAFVALGKYAALVLILLAVHLLVTYSVVLKLFAKRNPLEFFRQVRVVMLTAFSTSSSNATLPAALRSSEEDLKIPREIGNFVLTVGATANQNGTALFEGVTVLFLAQLFGIQLSIAEQFTVIGLAILAGIGTAGVPGGSWPMIAAILVQVNVPPAAIALCIGIDRILDMSRTVVNVIGDMTIAACVARSEGLSGADPALSP